MPFGSFSSFSKGLQGISQTPLLRKNLLCGPAEMGEQATLLRLPGDILEPSASEASAPSDG